jgi:RND family efflux transporter MFP subunit
VGAVNVFVGSTVQLGVTPLVTITQLDPIAVSFNLPQSNLADVLTALKNKATVMVKLPDGSPAYKGRVQFVDSVIDASAGTIKVKALVANPDGKLWPGAFVDTQLTLDSSSEHIVIPQAAIIQTARGSIVYAVVDGKAVSKPVELINAQGGNAAVKGVEAGDKVVLDGRQNLRPGVDVVERSGKPDGAKTDSAKAESKPTSKP